MRLAGPSGLDTSDGNVDGEEGNAVRVEGLAVVVVLVVEVGRLVVGVGLGEPVSNNFSFLALTIYILTLFDCFFIQNVP